MTDEQCIADAIRAAFGDEATFNVIAGRRRAYDVTLVGGPSFAVKFAPTDTPDEARADAIAEQLRSRRDSGTL